MSCSAANNRLLQPNIVQVLDVFCSLREVHLVMELLEGGDLFDRIVDKQRSVPIATLAMLI